MNVELDTRPEVFQELESEWNELLHRSTSDQIFLTWEWQSLWWDSYHPGSLWLLTCRDDNDKLLGIAPWFKDPLGTVRCIGCEDVTDYLDMIIDADHVEAVLECFAGFLRDNPPGCIQLCNFPEASPNLQQFTETLKKSGFEVRVDQQEVCPVIELPEAWEDYLSALDKKQRHEVRRKMRRVKGNGNRVAWYTVDKSHDIDAEIDRFLKLMAESDPEKKQFLQDEKHVLFFNRMVRAAYQNGWLRLNFLTINDEHTAAYLNFDYNNRILVYNSGLAMESQYNQLSPGIVLLAYNIREAIENNYDVFDFLRGNETYKYRMGGQDTGVYQITAQLADNPV